MNSSRCRTSILLRFAGPVKPADPRRNFAAQTWPPRGSLGPISNPLTAAKLGRRVLGLYSILQSLPQHTSETDIASLTMTQASRGAAASRVPGPGGATSSFGGFSGSGRTRCLRR
jgi:hypothetical protein